MLKVGDPILADQVIDHSSYFSVIGSAIFFTALVGLLLEESVAVRVVLLLEVGLVAVVGLSVSFYSSAGSVVSVLSLVVLVLAAVESILFFGFIVLLHRLRGIYDLVELRPLQF